MSIDVARRVLTIEGKAVFSLIERLGKEFECAVKIMKDCKGRVVVMGMGKSGIIGQKISATFASTSTPSLYVHAAEGIHGDLGMITKEDVVLAVSNSGETDEILVLLPAIKRLGIKLISLVGNMESTLAKNSDVVLNVSVHEEACPLNLVPTASTTAALAMGDALAIALFQERGLKEEDFALLHPGGILGRKLILRVEDLMHKGEEIPVVKEDIYMKDVILEMTSKRLGVTSVVDDDGKLMGVITDGDLRRQLEKGVNVFERKAKDCMTLNPKIISKNELAVKALEVMEYYSITSLLIVDKYGGVEGIIHLHDILKSKVV